MTIPSRHGQGSRARIVELLRSGFIREQGFRRGTSRPAMVYELVPEAAASFSRAYIPFVAHLLKALPERMSQADLEDLMRSVGRNLAAEWPPLRGDLRQRTTAANALLEELGALTEVETTAQGFVIRGHGCLLS